MQKPLIIALDFQSKEETEQFLDHFKEQELFLKVGMELFYQEGPDMIKRLKNRGHKIFLDLKLHDIPNTVNRSMAGLARLGCDLVNVHAAGGKEMMKAAIDGLDAGTPSGIERPKCVAVTQLTSTTEQQMQEEQLIRVPIMESVCHYAEMAEAAKMDGVVCSVYEAETIRTTMGAEFLTIVPGIRSAKASLQDQKRVGTPDFARKAGVSAIVVGRPITLSNNPLESYQIMLHEWKGLNQ